MGISVLSPDVNESFVEFAVVPDKENPDNRRAPIRFGMAAIKNVGTGAVEEILRARKECGKFETSSSSWPPSTPHRQPQSPGKPGQGRRL
jgi:DNA polymerase III alpha subunit